MKHLSLTLYLEINNINFIFFASNDDQNNFKTIYKLKTKLGCNQWKISNIDKISDVIKENIYTIEKKLNYTFKEIIIILENFNPKFINFLVIKS